MKIRVNADDFGLSHGVNQAIFDGIKAGSIHSTSLMVSAPFTDEAVQMAHQIKKAQIGLHFNLIQGKSCLSPLEIPLLVGADGTFKNGFVGLLILSFLHPIQFKKQVQMELYAQYDKMASFQIPTAHIDGHQHIQMIPAIFKLVQNLVQEKKIPHIRLMNENLGMTVLSRGDYHWIKDGGLIKWILLKAFYYWNRAKTKTYFYSVLHTGRLFGQNISHIRVPKKYEEVELMIHPSYTDLDTSPFPYPNPQNRDQERLDASTVKII